MWEPVVNGSFLPEQPVRMTGSRDIPLLIGNNRTEWESFPEIMNAARSQYDNKNTWSDTEIDKKLTEKYGARKDAKKLETEMSQAWLNFARTGTLSAKGLPKWEPFTEESGAVMIFDQQPRLVHHHDDKLLELVTAARKK